ncbi:MULTISPECIES: MFS transporter [Acidithiobacillus]|uniref:MFS transporter n=1 Tax=Acidithiobacillus TaxID=119977 RepID=UPI00094B5596|nr:MULTISPECIES: MFS transporter [Acidithiobacillus]MBE7563658.1 MFS transporter [Acidithiobacillus sp. HP-6]MBE7569463.1 MFS transporter [Acidithiobacillus sp. HP-2]
MRKQSLTSSSPISAASAKDPIRHGTRSFRKMILALFAAGFATFSMIYCVQPLMPAFSREYGVTATGSALSLSLTTGILAFSMLLVGNWSDRLGRKSIMVWSLFTSAFLVLATGFAPNWEVFLLERALLGISISGLPAVAMTYLNEEVHADSIGIGMGLYISGSAVGGMSGRLIAGVLANYWGWHVALASIGVISLIAAVLFVRSLPDSQHFSPQHVSWNGRVQQIGRLFNDPGLPWLFVEGFFLMGIFVTFYNYLTYRLMAPPYDFSQAQVGLIFSVYGVGIFSSPVMGHIAGRIGRRKVLWMAFALLTVGALLSFAGAVWAILLGTTLLTFGFFGGHSIASSWVGRRAPGAKAQAASLYLFFYYLGSAVLGSSGGYFYSGWGWEGVAELLTFLAVSGLLIAWKLRVLPPLTAISPIAVGAAVNGPYSGKPHGHQNAH